MKLTLFSSWLFCILLAGVAQAQNVVAVSDSEQVVQIVPHPTTVTFVAGNWNRLQDMAADTAISQGGGRAITSAAVHAVPVPFAGSLIADAAMGGILKAFHKEKPVKGANLAFVQGLSSVTAMQKGNVNFTIPAISLPGASPILLRINPSAKYTARIVRGVELSATLTGGIVNTAGSKILGIDQDAIPCRQELRDDGLTLIPNSPLEPGEYAIVLVPDQEDHLPVSAGILWDFRLF